MGSDAEAGDRARSIAPRTRGVGRILAQWIPIAFVCLIALELGARLAWNVLYGLPLRRPDHIFYAFYPELKTVDSARPGRSDDAYDVLLLGASTLAPEWGTVAQDLERQLAAAGHRRVRIFNLGRAAHSSRDSLLKYAALGGSRFELVVFYDGINETRATYVPPDLFREDYGHYAWYEFVNAMAPYHGTARLALPYSLRLLVMGLGQVLNRDEYVPRHTPRNDWLRYGAVTASAHALERNLRAILDLARRRGDPILLATFAIHIPGNYSRAAFKARALDYGRHTLPVDRWGEPSHVAAGVRAHNEVIRRLASEHREVKFVDVDRLMPRSGRYFDDVCHFTGAGSARLAGYLVEALAGTTVGSR